LSKGDEKDGKGKKQKIQQFLMQIPPDFEKAEIHGVC
jgi:hypothetical protein